MWLVMMMTTRSRPQFNLVLRRWVRGKQILHPKMVGAQFLPMFAFIQWLMRSIFFVLASGFDPDDIFKERNPTPMAVYPAGEDNLLNSDSDSVDDGNGSHKPHIEYAYDAAAERKKELEREAKRAAKLRGAVPST